MTDPEDVVWEPFGGLASASVAAVFQNQRRGRRLGILAPRLYMRRHSGRGPAARLLSEVVHSADPMTFTGPERGRRAGQVDDLPAASSGLAHLGWSNRGLAHLGWRIWGSVPCSARKFYLRWWTWAGYRANATLKATLGGLADESQRVDDLSIRLRSDLRPQTWSEAVKELRDQICLPEVGDKALSGLKFSDALPRPLAVATLATRLADLDHAATVLAEPVRFER